MEQVWFTSNEAAEYLRITKPALHNMVYRKKLTAYKAGARMKRFKKDDLDALFTPMHTESGLEKRKEWRRKNYNMVNQKDHESSELIREIRNEVNKQALT